VATPTQSLQAVPSLVRFRLNKALQLLIAEKLSRRNITIEKYFLELIENDAAPVRLKRWQDSHPDPLRGRSGRPIIETKHGSSRKLTPEVIQKIFHIRDCENLGTPQLAERFGFSVMTIARILRNRSENSVHVPLSTRATATVRSVPAFRPEGPLVGFFPRIKSRRERKAV
jgi:hypothetical protein